MKKYIDEDIIDKIIQTNETYSIYAIFSYAEITGDYDFLLSAKDYIKIVNDSYRGSSLNHIIRSATFGRTKDDMPYFSIAGITFTMITEEEADKYRILK